MIKEHEISALNEEFIRLFSRVHLYQEKFSGEQFECMRQWLYEMYKVKVQQLWLDSGMEQERQLIQSALFESSLKEQYYVPQLYKRSWLARLFRRPKQNHAADLVEERVSLEAEKYFQDLMAENEALRVDNAAILKVLTEELQRDNGAEVEIDSSESSEEIAEETAKTEESVAEFVSEVVEASAEEDIEVDFEGDELEKADSFADIFDIEGEWVDVKDGADVE